MIKLITLFILSICILALYGVGVYEGAYERTTLSRIIFYISVTIMFILFNIEV